MKELEKLIDKNIIVLQRLATKGDEYYTPEQLKKDLKISEKSLQKT